MKKIYLSLVFAFISISLVFSQQQIKYYSSISESEVSKVNERRIIPNEYKVVRFNLNAIKNYLSNAPEIDDVTAKNSDFIIEIPMPDGSSGKFSIVKNNLLPKSLKAQFPQISTFDGQGIDDKSAVLKMDVTYKGFHAMIMSPTTGDVFIDPYAEGDLDNYIVYFRKDFVTNKTVSCDFDHDEDELETLSNQVNANKTMVGDCQLRTYRLALAATGEYTTYHGGTKALAQSAMTTTMNRVNGMFERDIAVTMVFVANNANIIYLSAATDPYANTSGDLNANQTTCDNVIGNANYDIGHLFGTGGGGIAQLNSPCVTGGKARGLTGSPAPVGDPFDIDYVAHEMGHQYGAPHTFNSTSGGCNGNRSSTNAWEPGSGLSIMAYAGLCSPHNVANLSSAFFYNGSMAMMKNNVMNGNSRTCPVVTNNGNQNPVASAGADYIIPFSTPFELIGSATDPNGNTLSYAWEEHDLEGTATEPPVATDNDGPMFRSFLPVTTPSRYFPRIQSIIANTSTTGFNNIQWEFLASVARTYTMRMTVRDNVASQGCSHEDNTVITVNGTAGPFIVTVPNTNVTWAGTSTQTVTWNVAGTTAAPINCANVNIYLSTNGGTTYPITVATNVPNTGSASITVPNVATNQARIRVQGANNVFFDISNVNFTITAATVPDFSLNTTPTTRTVCRGTSTTYSTTATSVAGFNSTVNFSVSGLPANTTASFSPTSVTPTGTTTLTVNTTATTPAGTYSLLITGISGSITKTNTVELIVNAVPAIVGLTSPANGATNVSITPTFNWSASSGATSYTIQIATDAAFTNIVQTANPATNTYTATALNITTTYHWRVRAVNSCGNSTFTAGFSFTTANIICNTYASTNIPATIPNLSTTGVTSTLTVASGVTITDINVSNLVGTHARVNDLIISLTSPAGTTVTLLNRPCTTTATNFNIKFDDAAASATIPCPPTDGNTYIPNQVLSAFNGENSTGTWTLRVQDMANPNGGSLTGWSIEICGTPLCTAPAQPSTITGSATVCSGTSQTYSVTNVAGVTYNWTFPTGWTQTAGGTTNSVTVTVGTTSGNISVTPSNACGNGTARTLATTVNSAPAQPGTISGTTTVCSGTSQTYSIASVSGATGYTWTVPAGSTITSGLGTTSITVTMGTTSGNIGVVANNSCGSSTVRNLAITINSAPAQPGTITGTTSVCSNSTQTYSIATVSGATSYTWTVPTGATITSGQGTTSINVTMGATAGNVSVTANNACGSSTIRNLAITINSTPSQPGTISGTTTVCSGTTQTYSIASVSGATGYTWTVPTGTTILSGQGTTSISVSMGTTSVNIGVTANNTCGSSAIRNLAVTINSVPATPSTITGATSACANSSQTFSISAVTGATGYTWTVPAGSTITSGQGTTSINITLGSTSGNVTVSASNTCGSSANSTKAVTITTSVTPSVSISTSSTTICSGANTTFTASPSNGGTAPNYQWQINGANVGTNSITFSTTTLTNGQVVTCIMTSNDACASPTVANSNSLAMTVISAPVQPGTITGNNSICAGTTITYSIASVNGATSYNWIAPTGATINSGQGTTSVSVTFGSTGGNVVVNAQNTCGTSTNRTRAITVNANVTPSVSISTGSTTICSGANTTFTASPTNGGSTPTYQWQVNGSNVGSNSATFSSAGLTNGQNVICIMTSNANCLSTANATSNTITMAVNQPTTATITETACGSFTLNSQTYTSSGTFTQNLANAAGCDSTITLNLTINLPTTVTITETACGSFTLNSQTYTSSGTFTQNLTNAAGCDSTITLNLTINLPTTATITETACGSFTLNSQTYTSSGTFTQNLTNAAGCDSTITLNLTIDENVDNTTNLNGETISANQSGATYQWIDCDNGNAAIDGAINQSFTATANGNYAVIITNGTCSETSACVTINTLSVSHISHLTSQFSIYPNPTTGSISISGKINSKSELNAKLINMLGQVVSEFSITILENNTIDEQLNIGNLPSSTYWIQITDNKADQLIAEKIILQR